MDFPDDVTTNIFLAVSSSVLYCLLMLIPHKENVTKIHWSQWSQTEVDTTSLILPGDQLEASAVVYELRENHAHALHEVETQKIWLFDFSASSSDEFNEILVSRKYSGKPSQVSFYNH
jgi:hypothetical protein